MVWGLLAAACFGEFRFEMRHEHWRKSCRGTMVVDERGISYHGGKAHSWSWKYEDVQELKLGLEGIHLISYHDWRLLAGADRTSGRGAFAILKISVVWGFSSSRSTRWKRISISS